MMELAHRDLRALGVTSGLSMPSYLYRTGDCPPGGSSGGVCRLPFWLGNGLERCDDFCRIHEKERVNVFIVI